MANKSLRDKVKEFSVSLPLMENREKGDLDDLKGINSTITDYDFMKDDGKEYVAFIVEDDPQHFFFGGQVLTDNLRSLEDDGYGDSIRKEGLPVRFDTKKSKNKREYTTVEFYPGE